MFAILNYFKGHNNLHNTLLQMIKVKPYYILTVTIKALTCGILDYYLWQPCLLMDQNEMSKFYRGPSIDASYQVSYHLAKRFQRKSCFRNLLFLIGRFLKIFYSETTWPNEPKRGRKHLWKVLYGNCSTKWRFIWQSDFRGEDF
jgi:hypothetical protein